MDNKSALKAVVNDEHIEGDLKNYLITLMQKAEQKKPVNVVFKGGIMFGQCPNCLEHVTVNMTSYCGKCGQRLQSRVNAE